MISRFHVYIYEETRCATLDFSGVAEHIQSLLPKAEVSVKRPLLEQAASVTGSNNDGVNAVARLLAGAKLGALGRPASDSPGVSPGEVEYARRRHQNRDSKVYGIMDDVQLFCDVCGELIAP